MNLAQAVNATVNTPQLTQPVTGFGVSPLILGLIILAVLFLIFWALAKGSSRDSTYTDRTVVGTKGGRVRKTVTEYDDVAEDEDIL